MSGSQHWPLSQETNKASGVCSVCLAVRQLHLKDGTVHNHGPRKNPCTGSHKPPLNNPGDSAHATSDLPSTGPNVLTCGASSNILIPDWAVASRPLVKHIPRSARAACSAHLSGLLRCVVSNSSDISAWKAVLCWGRVVLGLPKRGGKRHNLTSIIKKRISSFSVDVDVGEDELIGHVKKSRQVCFADAVAAKLEDGNIRAAVRLLCSDEKPAEFSLDSLAKLQAKHPAACPDRKPFCDPNTTSSLSVDESDVLRAIRSFPAGSSGGLDGMRPQHLLDLVNCVESASGFISALTSFVNLLLGGKCHPEIIPIFFGGRLIALDKKNGGIRPIAIGGTFRRLTAKCASAFAVSKLAPLLAPHQLGVGVPGGCEAAVHATRRFLSSAPNDAVLAKLDFSNAFNSLHRDAMLSAVFEFAPELYRYCYLAYSQSSFLKFGPHTLLSEEGAQQGDPLGPLCFCLTVHKLLLSLKSQLNFGFLDDFTLGGSLSTVSDDVDRIATEGARLGLYLNVGKCELVCSQRSSLPRNLCQFLAVDSPNLTLLGAPLFKGQSLDYALDSCCQTLSTALVRFNNIGAHDALTLLRASFSAPKVMHLLRCAPCVDHLCLTNFDNLLRNGISQITNSDLTDLQWLQASLPVREGGLGVRKVAMLATSAFLASAAGTLHIQEQILAGCPGTIVPYVNDFADHWASLSKVAPLQAPLSSKQATWDEHLILVDKALLWSSVTDHASLARLHAVSAQHSGDWLHALPISSCGLRLDDEAVRVAVGFRLGVNLCVPHTCPCGSQVDARGLHGLSCRLAHGRLARHHALNDLVWRALSTAGVPSTKEPVGLLRDDGKRPDGLTLIPWSQGKSVAWDVTVIHSLADSYIASYLSPGDASELAATRKIEKYVSLPAAYIFQPIAFETLGAINESGISFLRDVGRRLSAVSGDRRATEFFFQRLSVALQRYNAIAFRGSFDTLPDSD